MPSRWVTFFQGSIPEVISLQSACEAAGIPTWVPDMNLIQADPFMRGGSALALELRVPEDRLGDAQAFRQQLAEEAALDPERQHHEPDPLEVLARRARWSSLLGLTAPIGIWLGVRYLRETRKLGRRSEQHGGTVAALGISVVFTFVLVLGYTMMLLQR